MIANPDPLTAGVAREVGIHDGDLSAPGTFEQKAGRLFLDKSSAIPLRLPGTPAAYFEFIIGLIKE